MKIPTLFSRPPARPAQVAVDRLKVVLEIERAQSGRSGDLVRVLQDEILKVVARHVTIERDNVKIKLNPGDTISTLEIDIEMPVQVAAAH